MKINHEHISATPDQETAPGLIQPSHWNADLVVSEAIKGELLVRDDFYASGLGAIESSGHVGYVLTDQGVGELPSFQPAVGGPGLGVLTFVIASFATPGNSVSTGFAGVLVVPWDCTIKQVTLLSADPSVLVGSIAIDLWKNSYANYPPTVADSICASEKAGIVNGVKSQDTTLTGWTKALAAGEVLAFNVDSVSGLTRVRVDVQVEFA